MSSASTQHDGQVKSSEGMILRGVEPFEMDINVRDEHQNLARDACTWKLALLLVPECFYRASESRVYCPRANLNAGIDMIVRRIIAVMKTIPEKWWLEGDLQGFVGKLAKRQYLKEDMASQNNMRNRTHALL
jgi:hypothetical protein